MENYPQICCCYCSQLGLTMDHPRIIKWLSRAGMITQGKPYTRDTAISHTIYGKLARLLELRCECQKFLDLLHWDWLHPKVREVEAKYGCTGELPLHGYLDLREVLDDEWFIHSGGF